MAQPQQTGFQQYDPGNAAPYQAPVMPDPEPARPSPLPTEMPQANGAVKTSGAIATVADGILRGFMNGRAYHQAGEVMKLKKKTDDLQNSYNQDAVRLYQLHQAGVDPNSDEYKAAKSSVDGSWGALMDFYGKHVEPDDTGKKKTKKEKVQGSIAEMIQSKDPMAQSQAWYKVAQKMGPPVYGQIATLNTPQAKAQREAQNVNAQTGVAAAKNTATEVGQQTGDLQHRQVVQDAQKKIDDLNKIPQNQWTEAQRQEYNQAQQQVEPRKPGDEAKVAADAVIRKSETDPKYQFSDQDKEVLRAAGYKIDPHLKTQVTKTGEIIQFDEDGTPNILRGNQAAYEPRGRSGGAGSTDKTYSKWDSYYKEHYPQMAQEERDALVRRKVEGASQENAGNIAHDAIAEPQQFDNDVISAAIDNLRRLPQYAKSTTLDDALANIVGQGDSGYQYHQKSDLGKPDSSGKYSGGMDEKALKTLERDLQTQIRAVMSGSKLTGMSPNERRAVTGRMKPLFGPAAAPQGSGTPQGSPPANAAQPAASDSSPAPQGAFVTQSFHGKQIPGMVAQGNLDITKRPNIDNGDGSHSSTFSMSFGTDKGEVLVPGVGDGKTYPARKLTTKEALDQYRKTGNNFGTFKDVKSADSYAQTLHEDQAKYGNGPHKESKGTVKKSAFLRENKGATDADWKAVKPQLQQQGYDVKDD